LRSPVTAAKPGAYEQRPDAAHKLLRVHVALQARAEVRQSDLDDGPGAIGERDDRSRPVGDARSRDEHPGGRLDRLIAAEAGEGGQFAEQIEVVLELGDQLTVGRPLHRLGGPGGGARVVADLAGPGERAGAEREHAAPVSDEAHQDLPQRLGQVRGAVGQQHAPAIDQRRPFALGQRQIGGELIAQMLGAQIFEQLDVVGEACGKAVDDRPGE
jgi:hypothetical protein